MTASMYILLILALIFASTPFITTKLFGMFPLKRKHFEHHLVELAAGLVLTVVLTYILKSRAGAVQHQNWGLYATVACLYLILAFPCLVWHYFWYAYNHR